MLPSGEEHSHITHKAQNHADKAGCLKLVIELTSFPVSTCNALCLSFCSVKKLLASFGYSSSSESPSGSSVPSSNFVLVLVVFVFFLELGVVLMMAVIVRRILV